MVGKRNAKPQSVPEPAGLRPAEPAAPEAGSFATIIVRKSAAAAARSGKPYDLIQAVIDFVNAMTDDGLYRRDELVLKAMQAYHADYYLAQVNNGGHSQFIHNCGANAAFVWADARAALPAMGAEGYADLLERMIAWVEENPEQAAGQTGFDGGRADYLDELDNAFYTLNKSEPMIDASARWILAWPELRLVNDADYDEAIRHVILMNPLREERLIERRISTFEHQINDWLHVSIGLAATACPETEIRLGLGSGALATIEGEEQTAWRVQTSRGARFAVVTKQWARLFELIEADNPPMPAIGDSDGFMEAIRDGRLAQCKSPKAGKRLSHVEGETIAAVIRHANRNCAAAAIDLMLRQIGHTGAVALSAMAVAADDDGKFQVQWIVATEEEPFIALTHEDGAVLLRPGEDSALAKLPADDIVRHAGTYGKF